jgi:membrane-associated phospholipid phosphatase
MKRANGMPSGHAQQTAFALTVAYKMTKKMLYPSILLFLLTVVQRYVYRNHTIAQLAAGSVLGIILGCIGIYVMDYIEHHQKNFLPHNADFLTKSNEDKIEYLNSFNK